MSNVLLEKCANFLKFQHYWQHTDFKQPELEVLVHCPFSVWCPCFLSYCYQSLLEIYFCYMTFRHVNYLSKICYIAFYFYS